MKHNKFISIFIILSHFFVILSVMLLIPACSTGERSASATTDSGQSGIVQADKINYPEYQGFINDYAGKLDSESKNKLENLASQIERETGSEIVVVIVGNLQGLTEEEYAVELFERWGIGKEKEDEGILILLGVEGEAGERALRIEVGYGLEGIITDIEAGNIADDILIPELLKGDFYNGIYYSISAIADQIYEEKGLAPVGPGASVDINENESSFTESAAFPSLIILLVVFIVFLPWVIILGVAGKLSFAHYIRNHKCPKCNRIGLSIKQTVLVKPTYKSEGLAEVEKKCKYCDYQEKKTSIIKKLSKSSSHGTSSRGPSSFGSNSGHSRSSGGFGGFGGGSSGGGGASRRW